MIISGLGLRTYKFGEILPLDGPVMAGQKLVEWTVLHFTVGAGKIGLNILHLLPVKLK